MTARSFHLGDILSITTGALVSPRRMDAIYDLCNHMTGDNLFTHQLPRAASECEPEILRQHPDLRSVEHPDFSTVPREQVEQAVADWLAVQVAQFGECRNIRPLPAEAHTVIDPLDELAMNYPHVRVLPVVVDGGDR